MTAKNPSFGVSEKSVASAYTIVGGDCMIATERQTQCKYIELLVKALQEFYVKDAKDLFKDKMVDERAMVGCIYRYMWCSLQRMKWDGIEHDIDIEYDRMNNKDGDAIRKTILCINKHKDDCKHEYEFCGKIIEDYNKKECNDCKDRQFRPDIIVHRRMSELGEGNGLVVEFKKDRGEKSNKKDDLFDMAKVMYCTCDKGDFRYKVGACVKLFERLCKVLVFINGENVFSFSVNCSGRIINPTVS